MLVFGLFDIEKQKMKIHNPRDWIRREAGRKQTAKKDT
jgi:hypothetical protein